MGIAISARYGLMGGAHSGGASLYEARDPAEPTAVIVSDEQPFGSARRQRAVNEPVATA